MKKVLIFAKVACRIIAKVETLPKEGEDFQPISTSYEIIGSAFSSASVFNKFNFDYELIAPIGTGVYGEYVTQYAEKQGIELDHVNEGTQGVEYVLQDKQRKESGFVMPGSEYDFDESFVEYLDEEEISAVIAYSDLFCGSGADMLVDTISRLDCPFYFLPNGNLENIEDTILEDIYNLSPVLCLADQDISFLTKNDDFNKEIEKIQTLTQNAVVLWTKNDGILYRDFSQDMHLEWEKTVDGDEHELTFLAFIVALISGVDVRNSLYFSKQYLEKYIQSHKKLDDYDYSYLKQQLVHLITMK